jgi:hypothetical protein
MRPISCVIEAGKRAGPSEYSPAGRFHMSDKKPAPINADELRPDGWQRFEQAVDAAIKSGPKNRPAKAQKRARKPKAGKTKRSDLRGA